MSAVSAGYTALAQAAVASSSTVNADPMLWTGTSPAKSSTTARPLLRFNARVVRDASPSMLTAFTNSAFSGNVAAPYGGTGQTLGVWDVAAGVLSETNAFAVTSAGTLAVSFSGNATEDGVGITGTVTASAAPSSDLTVALTPSSAADVTLPASVTILAGQTTATFAAGAVDDAIIEALETISVTASGTRYDTGSGSFTITDNDGAVLSVTLPASVTEGGTAGTGTVTASAAAPVNMTISLAAAPTSLVTVPTSVTLPAGQTSVTFSISAVNNTAIDGTRSATVTASTAGWTSGNAALDVLDNEALTLTLNLASTTPREGDLPVSGTVVLSGTTATALTVALSSDDTSEATVPASVTIAAGTSSTAFTLSVVDDALTDGSQPVLITASAAGFTNGTRSLQVLDNDIAGFAFATVPNPQVRNTPFAVTITSVDVNGVLIPTYTGTVNLSAAGAGGAVAVTPAVSGTFVNGSWSGSLTATQAATGVTITATGTGGLTGTSNTFDVLAAGALSQFAISGIGATHASGTATPVTLTAQDAAGNIVTGYNGNASFSISAGPSAAEVVTGTGTSGSSIFLSGTSHDSRVQMIYTPTEVGAARTLRSIAVNNGAFPVAGTFNNYTIRLKHTTKTNYSAAGSNVFETTGWTVVYQANQSFIGTGWTTFNMSQPFAFNGTDNLMVDISFNNAAPTSNGTPLYSDTSFNRIIYATSNSTDGDPLAWNGSNSPSAFTISRLQNLRFSGFLPVSVTPAASGTFASGVWSGNLTFASSGPGVVLRALNGAGISGQTAPFTLNGAVMDHFDFAAISSPQTTGVNVTVTAKDANNMPVPGFTGTAALSAAEQAMKAQTGLGSLTWSIPLGSQSREQRMQVIYLASELGGTARRLTGLDLNPSTAPGSTLNNFTIRVKHTTKADFAAAGTAVWESTGWSTVFQGNVTIAEAGWVSFPFTTPFEYDGTRNLMVDYSYNNASTGAVQGFVRYSTAATNRTVLRQTDLDEGDPLAWNEWSSPVPTASTVVPNARFSSSAALPLTPVVTGSFTNGVWSGNLAVNQPASRVELTASASGSTGTSGLFNVSGLGTLLLSLAASAAEGAAPLTATLTRGGSTTDALTVNISSSNTTEATVSSASVTIPAGSASTTFNVNVVNDTIADGPQSLVISATAVNYTAAEAPLTVTDNEALALTVSTPLNIAENVVSAGTGYVRVNQAPATALTVNLTSSDTTELTVPASVVIAAGSLIATFAITAVDDTLMDGPQTVNVTASAAGHANGVASTVVQDNESFLLSLSTTSVVENAAPLSSTVSLSGAAAADVTVSLSVNEDSELLLAPNTSTSGSTSLSVTIPSGSSSIIIALVPVDDAVKDGNQSVTVTLSAPGFTTTPRFVNVIDDELERYVLSPVASPQTVGAAFSVTVTAQNTSGSTITNRSGTLNLAASNATGVLAMTPESVTLTGGTGTFNASLAAPASGVSITATDAQNVSAQSSVFDVIGAGALNRLAWNTLTTPQLIESPISATVTARDAANNVVTSYTGPADLKLFSTTADTTIGAGTTSWTTPLGSSAHARTQGIYLASEMGVAKRLTGLALNVVTSSATLLNNFTIRLKHTSSTSFSSAAWESGWTTVFSGTRTYNATGWQNTVFTRPFDYDGVSNVMVDISFGNLTTGTAVALQASTTAAARSVTVNTGTTSNGLPTTWTGTTNTPSTSTNLLNVRFTNATPVTVAGSGTVQNTSGTGTGTTIWPLGTGWHDQRTQMIYTPAEVGGAMTINSVAFDVSTLPGQVMNAFTIRMKHTATADYSSRASWDSTGWTTVYSTNQTVSTTGWNTFNLTTPFAFNGSSNLMVDICFNNSNYTSDGYCRFTTSATPRVISYQTDSGYGDPLTWTGTSTPAYSDFRLPNMRFSGALTAQISTVVPASTSGFTNGIWTGAVSARTGGSSVFLAADDPATGISGYSNAIAINSSGTLALTFLGTLAEGNGTVANGGTLTVSAAPASALTVALTSANPAQMTVPATVNVPAGQTSVSIPVTIINDSIIEGPQSIAVTAIAPGYTRVTANAAIADNDGGTFTLTTPASVAEGSSSFTATLSASATSPVAVTVSLSSIDTTELTVPATVTLPANASSVNFTVTVVDDVIQDGPQNAVITASATNWTSGTATVSVTDNDALPTLLIQTYSLTEGATNSSNYIYISPAPASAVTVALSSDSGAVTVPATVTVATGSNYGYFTTTAPEDSISTGTRYATISASATGYRPAALVSAVTDNDVSAYRIANITGTPVAGAPVSVTVTAISADGSTVTAYTGTVNLSASGSSGVVPVTPAISGSFSSGVWTGNVAFNQVTTGIVLSATDAQSRTGSSNAFNTTFSTLDHFTWATVPSPQAASTPFNATVMAKDVYENTVASFTGPAQLSALKPGTETTSGTGVVSSTTLLTGTYDDSRTQSIYLPVEVGGAQTIGAVSFNVTTASAIPFANFTVRMKHATRTDFVTSPTWDSTGWTTVYRGAPAFSVTGWNQLLLTTPFTYNGTDNLMVDVVWDKTTPGNGVMVQSTTISPVRSMYYGVFTSWGYSSPLTWSGTYPSYITTTSLPNMRFQRASTVVVLPQSTGAFAAGAWTAPLTVTQSGTGLRLQASGSGVQSLSNTFNVTTGGTLSLTLAASAIEGAAPLTATLGIDAAPVSDLMVTLVSTNTSAATVPATVTIPVGQTSVTFPVTVVDDALLDGTQSAVITALVTGYDAGVSTLNVEDNETTTITLTLPATLAENATATTVTVTLSNAAGSDVTLPLTSSDTTELSVPASVTIPAGSTSVNFAISPVDDAVIDFTQNVTVSTGMAGWTGASGIVSTTDNETAVLSLNFISTVVEGSGTLNATLTSSNPVQNSTTVTLSSADTTEATVPVTATIAAGASSTTFTITIIDDTLKDGSQTFAITTSAAGFTTASSNLTVTDNDVHNFLVSTVSSPQVRNQPFNVTFTARDVNNATITSYAGTPALTALDGPTALTVTPATVGSFSSGVRTMAITVGSFATNAVLTLTDAAAAASGSSNAFAVGAGAHSQFAWSTINSPKTAGTTFPVTITAQDSVGNTITGFTGTANLTAPTGLVSIGSAGSTVSAPLSTNAHDVRSQLIFTATEMGAAARSISSMALNVSTLPGQMMSNFTIRMRHTSLQNYSSFSWESTGWTVCYQTNQTISSTGWNTFTFTTPFAYNGTDSMMVDISFNNSSSSTSGAVVSTFISAGVRHMFQTSNSSFGDPLTWTGTTNPGPSFTYDRPDVRFGYGGTGATPTPATTTAFTSGVWNGNVTIPAPATAIQLQATSGSIIGSSNSFNVNAAYTLGLTLPASAVESASSVSGTVTLSAAQATATTINLSSNDTTEANPAVTSVTIPAGSTSANFTLNILNDTLADGAQIATITASVSGGSTTTANISIIDDDLAAFTWNTISSPKTSGAAFYVTINARTIDGQPATAFNGSTASLSALVSGSTASVTPTTGAFTSASWTGNVTILSSAAGPATITATSGGASGTSAAFSFILPTLGVTLPTSASESAGTVSGTISMSTAQTVTTTVNLISNDTTEAQPATASVTIPAGSTSVGFTLNIINDSLTDGAQTAAITASATGANSGTRTISITDDDVHNFLISAVGGTQVRNAPFNVTFTARDLNNVTITGYNGSPVLTASDGGTSLAATPGTISGFSSGVKSQSVTVGSFATSAVLTLTDPVTGGSGSSNAFFVTVGPMSKFAWDSISPPKVANVAFPVTITAQDAVGNSVTSYSGSAALSALASSTTLNVGTGSVTNYAIPFNTIFTKCRSQQVHLASEVGAAGLITSLAINVTSVPVAETLTDFTIRLKHTARTGYSVSPSDQIWETNGFTTVYQGSPTISTTGYVTFTFSTPFAYDGVSSLMVDYSYSMASNTSNRPTVTGTTRGNSRTISFYTSTTTNGEPLTWAGTSPAAFPDSRITDIRLNVASYYPLSPTVSTAFTNGVWTGTLSIGSTASSVSVIAADASLTGTSNNFEVIATALTLSPEPVFTGGLTNILSWNQPAAGLEYELERSSTPGFATPVSSGYLTSSTTTLAGLADGQTYHYRARMRRQGALSWTSDWSPAVFSTQDATPPVLSIPDLTTANASTTLTGTATDATSGVSSVTVAGNAATTANAFANWTRSVTGLADGSNSITLIASDNAVPPNTRDVTAIVYRITAPTGDPNNNGINSLVEHALGIPAGAPNAHSMLPAATVQTESGTGAKYLSMQFRRRIQRAGLAYTMETSTNLSNWDATGASVQEMSATPTGDGVTETVTVRVTPAMSASNTKGYVRLRITTN